MNLGAVLITFGVGVLCYIIGRIRGFNQALQWIASPQPEESEESEFVEAQRKTAPWQ